MELFNGLINTISIKIFLLFFVAVEEHIRGFLYVWNNWSLLWLFIIESYIHGFVNLAVAVTHDHFIRNFQVVFECVIVGAQGLEVLLKLGSLHFHFSLFDYVHLVFLDEKPSAILHDEVAEIKWG